MQYELFPDSIIALNQEVVNHPQLQYKLSQFRPDQLTEKLAAIATYCDIVIEGYFGEAELDNLCDMLTQKLRDKGSILILP